MSRGHLFVLSGPSGTGKGTLRKALFNAMADLVYSISCTTRPPRPGEVDGVDYHFISPQAFERLVEAGAFLEEAHVHGHRYGTLREDVVKELEAGRDVVLEIDVQGARQVKEGFAEAILLFVQPPSTEELERRLRSRGTEDEANLDLRLRNAEKEMALAKVYDHTVLNDDLKQALQELQSLIRSYRR